jgi:GDP-mannose 6-dehydrogenase
MTFAKALWSLVHLIKRLLGEGCEVSIWDPDVAMGRLVGSNRQYIEEEIPHISPLLQPNLQGVIANSEVIVIGTSAFQKDVLEQNAVSGQILFDPVHARNVLQLQHRVSVQGLCW